jgi:hypothetical protein
VPPRVENEVLGLGTGNDVEVLGRTQMPMGADSKATDHDELDAGALENRQQRLAVERHKLAQARSLLARSRPRTASRLNSALRATSCSTRCPGVVSSNSRLARAASALPSGVQFPMRLGFVAMLGTVPVK